MRGGKRARTAEGKEGRFGCGVVPRTDGVVLGGGVQQVLVDQEGYHWPAVPTHQRLVHTSPHCPFELLNFPGRVPAVVGMSEALRPPPPPAPSSHSPPETPELNYSPEPPALHRGRGQRRLPHAARRAFARALCQTAVGRGSARRR